MRYRYMEGMSAKRQKLYLEMTSKLKTYEKRHTIASEQEGLGLDVDVRAEQNEIVDEANEQESLRGGELNDKIEKETEYNAQRIIDIEKISPLLKTEPDTAFFWSGNTNGIGGMDVAADIAKKNGGVTLEMVLDRQDIHMPEFNLSDSNSVEIWQKSSACYAKQASGVVRAVIGNSINPKGVWNSIELPELKRNQNVTKIIIIDPQTLNETVIFSR